jgi:aminomethyltransferase
VRHHAAGCRQSDPTYGERIVSNETNPRQSPLLDQHLKLGAKMIEFGGWNMPVYYSSILQEHRAVRRQAGIFDISHMGEITVAGPSAEHWLNTMLTNNLARLEPGAGQYTLLLNERGGVIDDLIVYRRGKSEYFLVVNAAKTDEDVRWLRSHAWDDDLELSDLSSQFAALAVQGPCSPGLLGQFGDLPARNHLRNILVGEVPVLVARTGYTGEDGFELFYPATEAAVVWNDLLERGGSFGIEPCGLGARDTLRLEAGYPLNGADLSPARTPLEAGLRNFVDLAKSEFVGRPALIAQNEAGLHERLVAIKAEPKSPPLRAHYGIFVGANRVGELTSGTQSPSLGIGIGLGYVDTKYSTPGQKVEIDVRGHRFAATIEKKPLYKRQC